MRPVNSLMMTIRRCGRCGPVALEELVGLQRVIDVVDDRDILDVVEALALQEAGLAKQVLELLGAFFGEVGGALLLVDFVIAFDEQRDEGVDRKQRSERSSSGPEMISGVRASLTRIESTSSPTIAKL